jgi:hypothetical protein
MEVALTGRQWRIPRGERHWRRENRWESPAQLLVLVLAAAEVATDIGAQEGTGLVEASLAMLDATLEVMVVPTTATLGLRPTIAGLVAVLAARADDTGREVRENAALKPRGNDTHRREVRLHGARRRGVRLRDSATRGRQCVAVRQPSHLQQG